MFAHNADDEGDDGTDNGVTKAACADGAVTRHAWWRRRPYSVDDEIAVVMMMAMTFDSDVTLGLKTV